MIVHDTLFFIFAGIVSGFIGMIGCLFVVYKTAIFKIKSGAKHL